MVNPIRVLLHIIIITLASYSTQGAVGPIAKPGCERLCGNMSIPYPFGMDSLGCSFDKWFQIYCRNSTTPFLKLTNAQEVEVLNIDLIRGTVKINHPISFLNCGKKRPFQEAANLTTTPFVFSQVNNRFTCDSTLRRTSCNGMNCCQTTIPKYYKIFKPDFDIDRTKRDERCMYAFLVEHEWIHTMFGKYSDIADMENVPVVLEWRLYNWTRKEFPLVLETKTGDELIKSSTFYCKVDNSVDRNQSPPPLQCLCKHGFDGNPYIHNCQDVCLTLPGSHLCYESKRHTTSKKLILGLSMGFGLLVFTIAAWCSRNALKKRERVKRKEKFFKRNGGLLLQQQMSSTNKVNVEQTKVFTSKELKKATDNFNVNRILGQGGQGTVFKGMLSDGRIVAVKMSKILDEGKITEFINEIVILSQINHRNVVKVLGCCLETEVPLLVYEYIPNGTLSEYIHNRNDDFPFTWKIRLRVVTEIASALSYLHSSTSSPIYHRDIKSTNILLDEKYRVKIADFGTSKSVNIDQTHVTTQVHGTFGYLDPEYFQSNQFTDKSDVYSFGVLLVELLTGQKAISLTRSQEGRSLATYFIVSMQRNQVFDILDTSVLEGPRDEILAVANIAKRCLNLNSRKRPSMKEVTVELEGIEISKRASAQAQTQLCEEFEYVRTQEIEPWDVVSTSIGLSSDNNSGDRYELPLLSFTN
ncbi:wall-associated receptor kinase-like 10 isoform X1 [Humulus lupulus]|uniref:wall-associated receptor kinase-like 10 isoform X1 n=1 Tax=Humulus lupulus TaxID=3486 RepID=UPI002B4085CB|nr:wall-associated receptor kinase-like 10 isoform X1 [Humulus lupulus]